MKPPWGAEASGAVAVEVLSGLCRKRHASQPPEGRFLRCHVISILTRSARHAPCAPTGRDSWLYGSPQLLDAPEPPSPAVNDDGVISVPRLQVRARPPPPRVAFPRASHFRYEDDVGPCRSSRGAAAVCCRVLVWTAPVALTGGCLPPPPRRPMIPQASKRAVLTRRVCDIRRRCGMHSSLCPQAAIAPLLRDRKTGSKALADILEPVRSRSMASQGAMGVEAACLGFFLFGGCMDVDAACASATPCPSFLSAHSKCGGLRNHMQTAGTELAALNPPLHGRARAVNGGSCCFCCCCCRMRDTLGIIAGWMPLDALSWRSQPATALDRPRCPVCRVVSQSVAAKRAVLEAELRFAARASALHAEHVSHLMLSVGMALEECRGEVPRQQHTRLQLRLWLKWLRNLS
jgi:hypothetical protein